jgi:hypothetical protein
MNKYIKDYVVKGFSNISKRELQVGVEDKKGFVVGADVISFINSEIIDFPHPGKYQLKSGLIITTQKGIITKVESTKHKKIQQKFKSDYDNHIRRKKKLQLEAIRKLFK